MALINSSGYSQLSKMAGTVETRKPGKFFNVCISGKRHGKVNAGYYQCFKSFEDENSYFVLNESEVYFLPLYIKRYWVKYTKGKDKNGNDTDVRVAFGWEDNSKKPDATCKYEYIVAGYLWDSKTNSIMKHSDDYDEAGIKAGDKLLVYFRCKGTRCSCGYELINKINDAAEKLPPLSDNPEFEKAVVNPRRFLIKATIVSKTFEFNAGNGKKTSSVDVFQFDPIKTIGDDTVQSLLDSSNKLLDDFNKQFDLTEYTAQQQSQQQNQNDSAPQPEQRHSSTPQITEADITPADNSVSENFDIEI